MNFGTTLERLKEGAAASRQGWNGVGQFLFLVDGQTHGDQEFAPYIAINDVRGTISPWTPTAVDLLADDWICGTVEKDTAPEIVVPSQSIVLEA